MTPPKVALVFAAFLILAASPARSEDEQKAPSPRAGESEEAKPGDQELKNTLAVLREDERFSVLYRAIASIELKATLKSETLTLFAPTNDAFLALGRLLWLDLILGSNRAVLLDV